MSKYIPGNHKHLNAQDRLYIEHSLDAGISFKDIARYLCKDPSTISKEDRSHRLSDYYSGKGFFFNAQNFCVHRFHCKKTNVCDKLVLCGIKCTSCPSCNKHCKDYVKERCPRLDRAPYVCNGCDKSKARCTIAHKYHYDRLFPCYSLPVFLTRKEITTSDHQSFARWTAAFINRHIRYSNRKGQARSEGLLPAFGHSLHN